MLLVDTRAGSRELLKPLQRMGLPAVDSYFDGDLAFEGRGEGDKPVTIGIEFKKVGELVGAMRTGRLQGHQLLKMRRAYDFSWLLIEGSILFDKRGRLLRRAGSWEFRLMPGAMSISELLKRVLVLQLRGGLNPWYTQNRRQTLRAIEALYRAWTDVALDQHQSHLAIYQPPPLIPISQFRQTLSTLPGIGLKNSRLAEVHFGGSIRSAINSGSAQWGRIEGIGPKTAKKIEEALTHHGYTPRAA
jgi:ERCC4-type nuclease